MRRISLLCSFLLGLNISIQAQEMELNQLENYRLVDKNAFDFSIPFIPKFVSVKTNDTLLKKKVEVPAYYSYEHLAAFCKLEVKIEKVTKLPVKIRLGEVNEVERLEGKKYTPTLW